MTLRNVAVRLTALEIWAVALAVVASMISTRLLPIALAVAVFFWIIRWITNGRLSVRTSVDWAIGLLALMMAVTLWATALPEKTLPQVYRLLTGILLFYTIVNWTSTPARLRLLTVAIVLAGLGLALMAPVSVEWSSGKLPFIPDLLYSRFKLLVADVVHPNVMAGSLVILLPIPFALMIFAWRELGGWKRLLSSIVILTMVGMLFLTKSRGAWIAFTLILVFLPILRWRWGWVGVVVLIVAEGVILYRFGITSVAEALLSSDTVGSVGGRVEVWSRAIYMIQDFSFTGIGMGTFGDVADLLYPFFLAAPSSILHSHNLFLQVTVDLGLPGLIAWLAILYLVLITSWRVYRRGQKSANGWLAGIGAGLFCSQLALMTHGLTDAVTWGMVRPAPIVWVLWGLAMAAGEM
jgi:putative inorganic carbon (HCO3(-)) transporter